MPKLLNPKPLSEIKREKVEKAQELNIDLYEAVAGLFEEFLALNARIDALEERVNTLTQGGGQ
ncbi:transcription factor [Lutispora thermophila]|uniref:Uncharacterized protein n=1 Tax=Lutispora thermophila DSM 19022 TaxID=1122184 RepID=A0A1M6ES66_9FIRM|nr:transcription factor [Lutispora thermophila]SHI88297.1 hypothetical protein SAMN02745176_01668 [Lutispora thermophila DSM 19022]